MTRVCGTRNTLSALAAVNNGPVPSGPSRRLVGSDWMILSGLNPGDRVILDNLLKLRPGATVSPAAPAEAKAATAPAAK